MKYLPCLCACKCGNTNDDDLSYWCDECFFRVTTDTKCHCKLPEGWNKYTADAYIKFIKGWSDECPEIAKDWAT